MENLSKNHAKSSLRRLVFKHTTDGGTDGTVSVEGWAQRLSPSMATWMVCKKKMGEASVHPCKGWKMPGSWGSRLPLAYQSPCQFKHRILANLAIYVICIGFFVPKKWQKLRVFGSLPTVTVQVKIPGCWVFILKRSFQNQQEKWHWPFYLPRNFWVRNVIGIVCPPSSCMTA